MKNQKPVFATNLRYLRAQLDLTAATAAQRAGIKRSTWQSYEEGRAHPPAEKLPIICEVLGFYDLHSLLTVDLTRHSAGSIDKGNVQTTLQTILALAKRQLQTLTPQDFK